MTDEVAFDEWAIVELMGHRRMAGRVTEHTLAGGAFVRVDVPGVGDAIRLTQLYSPSAIYCLTPCSEAVARRIADTVSDPVHAWDFPPLPAQTERAPTAPAEEEWCSRCQDYHREDDHSEPLPPEAKREEEGPF